MKGAPYRGALRIPMTHLFIEFWDGIIGFVGFIEHIYLTGKREMTILRSTGIYNICPLAIINNY